MRGGRSFRHTTCMINALQRAICNTHKPTRKLHGVWSLAAWQGSACLRARALNYSAGGGVSYASYAPNILVFFLVSGAPLINWSSRIIRLCKPISEYRGR